MKPILPLLLAAALASCTQYQYLTVSGVNVPKNNSNELISENDTLRVEYRFSRENGLVSVRLFNKTAEPLEVDWRRSAVVINDQTVGYYNNRQSFTGEIETADRRVYRLPGTPREVKGVLEGSEQLQFIPPHSFVESRPLAIPLLPLANLPEDKAEQFTFRYSAERTVNFKRFPFQPASTPARFRSYLTLRLGKAGAQHEFAVEHQFYISEVWKSTAPPEFFAGSLENRNDRFYLAQ